MSKNLWKNWRFEPEIIKETPDQSVAVQHTVARQATLLFGSIAEWVLIDHMEQNIQQTLQSIFLLTQTSCTTTSVPTFSQFLVTTCNKEVRDTHISQCWWTDGAMAMQNTRTNYSCYIYLPCSEAMFQPPHLWAVQQHPHHLVLWETPTHHQDLPAVPPISTQPSKSGRM
jgi:hypothetical protein